MKVRLTCERTCLCTYSEQIVGPRPKSDAEPSSLTTDFHAEGVERRGSGQAERGAEAADKTAKEDTYLKQIEGKMFREKSTEGKIQQHGRE